MDVRFIQEALKRADYYEPLCSDEVHLLKNPIDVDQVVVTTAEDVRVRKQIVMQAKLDGMTPFLASRFFLGSGVYPWVQVHQVLPTSVILPPEEEEVSKAVASLPPEFTFMEFAKRVPGSVQLVHLHLHAGPILVLNDALIVWRRVPE